MEVRSINEKDYDLILRLDKKVYPTASPVTKDILAQWYQNNPEFGFIFQKNKKINGMCVAIPLNKKGWKQLISGTLAESDLDSKTIFNNSKDKEIGIHIYHLEKFDNSKKGLHLASLKEIQKLITNLRKENPKLKIIGFSGLAVTSQGITLLYNKLNCREREFINTEHILTKQGKIEIFEANSMNKLQQKLKQGYEYKNRCKMLVLYPNEPSIVWNYLE
jgi:hypothetical protein